MTDIVERLRWHREHPVTGQMVLANPDGPEAAARIEQLENALTEIYKKGLHNQGGAYKNGFYDCFKIARRALGIPHMSFDAARAALGEKETRDE